MTMTRHEIETELNELYKELNTAYGCDEETARRVFGTDTKAEALRMLVEEIDFHENALQEFDEPGGDTWDDHGFADEADYMRWRHGA